MVAYNDRNGQLMTVGSFDPSWEPYWNDLCYPSFDPVAVVVVAAVVAAAVVVDIEFEMVDVFD